MWYITVYVVYKRFKTTRFLYNYQKFHNILIFIVIIPDEISEAEQVKKCWREIEIGIH